MQSLMAFQIVASKNESRNMEIDLYNPCPVHADKKIKFCCGKEITSELNQIVTKYQSRQPAAALDTLNQLIDRVGPKDCLLSLKVQILSTIGDLEQATDANEQFLANNVNHPLGLEHRALLLAGQGQVAAAYEALQDAMDNLPGSQIPVNFSSAFRAVSVVCLQAGDLWAGRAHAMFANTLQPDDEQTHRVLDMINNMSRSILLRRSLELPPAPEGDFEWKKKYENAIKAVRRGQFRKANQLMQKAFDIEPNLPLLVTGMALVASHQPYLEATAKQWRLLSESEQISLVDRVEAAAIYQAYLINERDEIAVKNVVFEFDDSAEEIMESALSNARLVSVPVPEEDEEADGPPPKAAFLFLDRDALDNASNATAGQIPIVKMQLHLFGKQTDRLGRLECVLSDNLSFEAVLKELEAAFKGQLRRVSEEVIGNVSKFNEALEVNWHLPPTIDRITYERLEKEEQLRKATEVLPDLMVGGKTLRELASDPRGTIDAQAAVARMALNLDGREWASEWSDAAHNALGLQPIPKTNLTSIVDAHSPFSMYYAIFDALPDEDLSIAFLVAMQIGAASVIRTVGKLLIERNHFDGRVKAEMVHLALAQVVSDDETCFQHMNAAKEIVRQTKSGLGNILVLEIEQRLLRGKPQGIRAIFQELQRNHLNDPGVADSLAMTLSKYGLITPDGQIMLPRESGNATSTANKLWTPDEAPGAGGSQSESKLWIPGQ